MNKIKFAHHFVKLGDNPPTRARLLSVQKPQYLRDIPKKFLDFDTLYIENGEEQHYLLPKDAKYFFLNFGGSNGWMFSTLRRAESEKFYRSKLAQMFEVVIET